MMTTSRLQLALNVTDIDAATTFYRDLFGVEPAKQRPGYANSAIPDPPLRSSSFCSTTGRHVSAQPPRHRGRHPCGSPPPAGSRPLACITR